MSKEEKKRHNFNSMIMLFILFLISVSELYFLCEKRHWLKGTFQRKHLSMTEQHLSLVLSLLRKAKKGEVLYSLVYHRLVFSSSQLMNVLCRATSPSNEGVFPDDTVEHKLAL